MEGPNSNFYGIDHQEKYINMLDPSLLEICDR
jgi:hypothetical protein